jgi:hypothetical protein
MTVKNQSNRAENHKAHMEMQNKEIKETLRHIKNKILVMSGKGGVGKSSRILLAIDRSERSFTASVYLGKVLSKRAEIVLSHVLVEVPEALNDVNADPLTEKKNYPCNKRGQKTTKEGRHL